MAEDRVHRRLAAILAADVAGYSRLMGEDEEGTLAALKAHRRALIDPKISEYRGRIVKTTGDGILIEFASVVDAVRCAVDVQGGMIERNAEVPPDRRIEFRVGINVGDIIIDGDDIYGDGVNLAARLEAVAAPGGICVSAAVRDEVRDKLAFSFEDMAEHNFKNIARPMRVFRIELGTHRAPGPAKAPIDPPLPERPSVAVLPFQNMSGDQEQEFFADGVTEDIITDLSKVSGVFVIGRQSSFVYKGKAIGLRQIGRELGVRYLLEGSVRKAGNRVRITAQLVDSRTDNHLWAERYDRNLEDIFAVQSEVAHAVVDALSVALLPEEGSRLGRVPTKNLEAYELVARAWRALHPPTRENIEQGRNLLERAVALDPGFAGGLAGLSFVGSLSVVHNHVQRSPQVIAQVTDLAEKAIALDPAFGWSEMALAWSKWIDGQHDEAIMLGQKAIALQPGDADLHGYLGNIMTFGGRPGDAVPHLERAIRLNPRSQGPNQHFLGYANAMAGNSKAAVEILNDLPPSTYSPVTYSMLILAHVESDDVAKAKEAAEAALQRYPRMTTATCAAVGLKNQQDVARIAVALRKAGIPD